jgi:menaquinone-dependent protoporphyrinogen IX oxidase
MRVLVAHGSEASGTAQIAAAIGETLREAGLEVDVRPATDILEAPVARVREPAFDAVVWTADWKPVTGPGAVTSVRAWAARVAADLAATTPAS